MAKMRSMKKELQLISNLQFLKLGGSLITDKDTPRSPRLNIIKQLACEIAFIRGNLPDIRLIIGHGSGSYGHVSAKKFNTRMGVNSLDEWEGFVEVWRDAAMLNHLLIGAFHQADIPAISFPISSAATAQDGEMVSWDIKPIQAALQNDLLPVVYGDVVFDIERGGTILSTEEIFKHLALTLSPKKILLAGIETGVWLDFPQCTQMVSEITPLNSGKVLSSLFGSAATDVTGGMASKVKGMLDLVTQVPGLEVNIFSGTPATNLTQVFQGTPLGSVIKSD
jgi:isopentenyl phosphate kinase